MCGVVSVVGPGDARTRVERGIARLGHRGPDSHGIWSDDTPSVALGQTRLRIIDLTEGGHQPMASADGRFQIVFNGELYNYLELRRELESYPFRSQSDTEVVLAAWSRWGSACLDRFLGMFAFVLWDTREHTLTAVRDRFGVKPLYHAMLPDGGIALASEIKALHAIGVPAAYDTVRWSSFLTAGTTDQGLRTFWSGVEAVAAGSILTWTRERGRSISRWYDLAARVGPDYDTRDVATVKEEYRALLEHSVRLRFRSDVPVGINLSGGVDSSTLLGLVHAVQGASSEIKVFTFLTGDPAYDELPWVQDMLSRTHHPLIECLLRPVDVPDLAARITAVQDEPYGGLPTLAYAHLFARARAEGVIVLLDGQGIDEQWAGYDYYGSACEGTTPILQGSRDPATRIDCLAPEFATQAECIEPPTAFPDRLRNLQLRDAVQTKLPRALRYNDRVSMAASTELREPFLDHRLFELAMRQPLERKIHAGQGKWLLREISHELLPDQVRLAAKRPVQTPQREWLRGPLRDWAGSMIERALVEHAAWFDVTAARSAWQQYLAGRGDNSYWVWQWLSLGLLAR